CISPAASIFSFAGLLARPRATLFPYTTLFRSAIQAAGRAVPAGEQPAGGRSPHAPWPRPGLIQHACVRCRGLEPPAGDWPWPGRDRKSTRLNSSHVKISYAVFCLKKKKNVEYI